MLFKEVDLIKQTKPDLLIFLIYANILTACDVSIELTIQQQHHKCITLV